MRATIAATVIALSACGGGVHARGDAGVDGTVSDASVDAAPARLFAFVTSQQWDGNLGGLSGADAKCQAAATSAGLPGTYRAWLSDGADGSPSTRFTHPASSTYTLVDGTVVTVGWSGLTSGMLVNAIAMTETGAAVPVSAAGICETAAIPLAFSATHSDGTGLGTGADCSNWTSNSAGGGSVSWGEPLKMQDWSAACAAIGSGVCQYTASLFCFQQ